MFAWVFLKINILISNDIPYRVTSGDKCSTDQSATSLLNLEVLHTQKTSTHGELLFNWSMYQLSLLLVEQELLTVPEHLIWPPVFSGVRVTRALVLSVCFVDRCLSFFLLAIELSVFLRLTDSDYLPLVSSNFSCIWLDSQILICGSLAWPITRCCNQR